MDFLKDNQIQGLESKDAFREFTRAVRQVQLLRAQLRQSGDEATRKQLKDATDYMVKLDTKLNALNSKNDSLPLFGESKASKVKRML